MNLVPWGGVSPHCGPLSGSLSSLHGPPDQSEALPILSETLPISSAALQIPSEILPALSEALPGPSEALPAKRGPGSAWRALKGLGGPQMELGARKKQGGLPWDSEGLLTELRVSEGAGRAFDRVWRF